MNSKIIQIVGSPIPGNLYALCEDGSVWIFTEDGHWTQLSKPFYQGSGIDPTW